jgi:hypothetical protein
MLCSDPELVGAAAAFSMIGQAHEATIAVPPAAETVAKNLRRDIPSNGLLLT